MRPPAQPVMTEHASENQLNVKDSNGNHRQGEQSGMPIIEFDLWDFFNPTFAGEKRQGECQTEESLRHRSMSRRNGCREEI